jgi:metal-dependent HD superfamily phosphatase/phosphodiesterase
MKSPRELSIDIRLIDMIESYNLTGKAMEGLKMLLADEEIQAAQEYANTVSIVRLGYNDHGPVHLRTVTYNAVLMMGLLRDAGVNTSLEADGCGEFEDSLMAVILAAMLHDLGMGMARQHHEFYSTIMARPIIDKILQTLYEDDFHKKTMIRAVALEGIAGHMGTNMISSLEAGIVQVADGCDMTKGRARIPISLLHAQRTGHIHQYSADSIEEVAIKAGFEKPIHVDVKMSSAAGLFQIEEVLMQKIANSTAKTHIELFAQVRDEAPKRYL